MAQFSLFEEGAPAPPARPAGPLTPAEKAERLEQLRAVAVECQRCGLAATRRHVVFGEGNPAAPLVLVGEGPGETEDATGRPFVGRAGKLLDEVLGEVGLTREHVYICNVLKCRAVVFAEGRARNRAPEAAEVEACRPWLEQQLAIVQPLVIVCLGAPAANVIIHRNFRMTQERGQWFRHSPFAPWVMAAYHPAFILRMHGAAFEQGRALLVRDLTMARDRVIELRRQLRQGGEPAAPRSLFG